MYIPSAPPVYPHPHPEMFFLFTTNNIGSGVEGFTAFEQNWIINEIVDKRARFRQVCQLPLSLIVAR